MRRPTRRFRKPVSDQFFPARPQKCAASPLDQLRTQAVRFPFGLPRGDRRSVQRRFPVGVPEKMDTAVLRPTIGRVADESAIGTALGCQSPIRPRCAEARIQTRRFARECANHQLAQYADSKASRDELVPHEAFVASELLECTARQPLAQLMFRQTAQRQQALLDPYRKRQGQPAELGSGKTWATVLRSRTAWYDSSNNQSGIPASAAASWRMVREGTSWRGLPPARK